MWRSARRRGNLDIKALGTENGRTRIRRVGELRNREKDAKKNELRPHERKEWVIPPEQNAEFVYAMESVLEVYHRPPNPFLPTLCIDEMTKQLVSETVEPIPASPGQPERQDYTYERNGTANLFMILDPVEGWRHVEVTERRTAVDYARLLKDIVDVHFPEAYRITIVQDNLNTHHPASLYKAFPPEEARRIIERLEFCYTPKHGSWLNMAEIELSVLSRPCLDRRIPDIDTLRKQVEVWEERRNFAITWINWRFTTEDARIKLKRLYPSIQD